MAHPCPGESDGYCRRPAVRWRRTPAAADGDRMPGVPVQARRHASGGSASRISAVRHRARMWACAPATAMSRPVISSARLRGLAQFGDPAGPVQSGQQPGHHHDGPAFLPPGIRVTPEIELGAVAEAPRRARPATAWPGEEHAESAPLTWVAVVAAGSGQVAPSTAALSHAMLYATATGRRPAQIWKLGARADAFSCALRSARNRRSGRPSDPRPGHAQWFALIRAQCACSRRYARPEGRRCPQPVGCRWNTLSCMMRAWIACRGEALVVSGGPSASDPQLDRPAAGRLRTAVLASASFSGGPASGWAPASIRAASRSQGGFASGARAAGPAAARAHSRWRAPVMTLPARWARGSSAGERDSVSQLPRSSLAARRPRRWAQLRRPVLRSWRRSRCRT